MKRSEIFCNMYSRSWDIRFTYDVVIPYFVNFYIHEYKGEPYYDKIDLLAAIICGNRGHLNPIVVEKIIEREWKRKYSPIL